MNDSTLSVKQHTLSRWSLLLTGLFFLMTVQIATAAKIKGGGNAEAAFAEAPRKSVVVEGTIKDAEGLPIIGATVAVKGSAIGALTDVDGHYILNNVPTGSILSISYVGMKPQEITVSAAARQTINVKMDADTIDEVVVVAFGTQKKESVISSIETINPKELKVPSSNLTTALAGRMSGVIAYQRSGEPGADGADFFIRGVTTFGYKVDPLILIDGVAADAEELNRLLSEDIETLSVLKDASSAAIHGARAAFGVILITTKQRSSDRFQVNYNNNFAWK
ncbi:MAG: carboxypeptidase-like regulatory domain-containing protein, partial [Alistipes sp.]|nr:carboxypeptidase-like regulatory domain-containing protein [Alistipes sp.]